MDKQVYKKSFQYLLKWNLASALITDEQFSNKIDEFHKELKKLNLTDFNKYSDALDKKILDYIYDTYEKVIVTPDEKVFGIINNTKIMLYDARDTKVYLDSTMD